MFYLLIPRALVFGIWTISITVLKTYCADLKFSSLKGLARQYPVASAGVILANLALAGIPLFANFPVRQALWENLAAQSVPAAVMFGISTIGLWAAALRSLAVLTMAPIKTEWKLGETWSQSLLIGLGIATLLVFGIFPQWAQPFLANVPSIFEHLGK